jgi:hypothetical protein
MSAFAILSAAGLLALAFVLAAAWLADTSAQNCPPQLAEGKDALARTTVGGQNADKLPQALAGARDEVQASRSQDIARDRNPTVNAV